MKQAVALIVRPLRRQVTDFLTAQRRQLVTEGQFAATQHPRDQAGVHAQQARCLAASFPDSVTTAR